MQLLVSVVTGALYIAGDCFPILLDFFPLEQKLTVGMGGQTPLFLPHRTDLQKKKKMLQALCVCSACASMCGLFLHLIQWTLPECNACDTSSSSWCPQDLVISSCGGKKIGLEMSAKLLA